MNNLQKQRVEKGEIVKSLGGKEFGHNFEIDRTEVSEFKRLHSMIEDDMSHLNYSLVGRVVGLRKMGKSAFIKIQEQSGSVQAFLSVNDTGSTFEIFKKGTDMGDIVHLKGYPFVTKTGELSLKVVEFEMITKSYNQLPDKHNGLKDQETKYRQRYLHMIDDTESMNIIMKRSKIISTIRRVFEDKGFLEVETPMLNPIPGGANAKPFITHHNALDVDRYLRIAPELYLKKLIVGGMEKVFEIGKNFRNEGIDATHNPEFTSVEFYQALGNYKNLMEDIEYLFQHINKILNGNLQNEPIEYNGQNIYFNHFEKITFKDSLINIGGIPDNFLSDVTLLKDFLEKETNEKIDENVTIWKLWEIAFDELVEKELIQPTFIIDYPTAISPLSRRKDENPDFCERFELFIAGRELANGFNELNDPVDQYNRFMEQVAQKDSDDEAMHMDQDFINALMQGMMPTAGAGIGIDRLVMLFTNQTSIKDVIAFPAMK